MKKIILLLLLIFPIFTNAQDTGWVIDNFHSDVFIKKDGKLLVKEYVNVDFYNLQKHGIYRDIPILYKDEKNNKEILKIKPLSVSNLDGKSINFVTTETSKNLNLKIGDPNILISGKQNYIISYEVEGALKNYGDYDELFWNVSGNNWPVPIRKVTSAIFLPDGVSIKKTGCFEGYLYSKKECLNNYFEAYDSAEFYNDYIRGNLGDSNFKPNDFSKFYVAYFNSNENLGIRSGLSVYVDYDPGIIPVVTFYVKPFYLMYEFYIFVLIILLTILFNIRNWYKNGRDYMYTRNRLYENDRKEILKPVFHNESITVMYEPPDNLKPGLIGILIDEKFQAVDFVSTVIDLVSRGYIEINEKDPGPWYEFSFEKDYYLNKIKEPDNDLLEYEKVTMNEIFGSTNKKSLSVINKNFFSKFLKIEESALNETKRQNLFVKNPSEAIKKSMTGKSLFFWIFSIVLSFILAIIYSLPLFAFVALALFVSLVITFIILAITAPQKTAKGRELYIESLGYRDFIKSVDKHRAKFYEDNNMFVKTLPYAIMFGMTDKYLNAMKQMGVDTNISGFNFMGNSFNDSLSSFSNSMSSASHASPRSSSGGGGGFSGGGGGFSGGGGGGGGGGSW